MKLSDRINTDISTAMKAKNQTRLSALRMLKAAVMNKGVEKGHDLDDAEVLQVVASLVKQRRDSIDQFTKAGRTDLVGFRVPGSAFRVRAFCKFLTPRGKHFGEGVRLYRVKGLVSLSPSSLR